MQIPDDDLESENPAALPTDDPPPSLDDPPSNNTQEQSTLRNISGTIPKRTKKCNAQEQRLEKAFNILEASASKSKEETECEIFGKFIGKKLEKYSSTTRINVQQAIMNIMFSADRGHYEPRYEQQRHPIQSNKTSSYPTSLNRSSQYSVPSCSYTPNFEQFQPNTITSPTLSYGYDSTSSSQPPDYSQNVYSPGTTTATSNFTVPIHQEILSPSARTASSEESNLGSHLQDLVQAALSP